MQDKMELSREPRRPVYGAVTVGRPRGSKSRAKALPRSGRLGVARRSRSVGEGAVSQPAYTATVCHQKRAQSLLDRAVRDLTRRVTATQRLLAPEEPSTPRVRSSAPGRFRRHRPRAPVPSHLIDRDFLRVLNPGCPGGFAAGATARDGTGGGAEGKAQAEAGQAASFSNRRTCRTRRLGRCVLRNDPDQSAHFMAVATGQWLLCTAIGITFALRLAMIQAEPVMTRKTISRPKERAIILFVLSGPLPR